MVAKIDVENFLIINGITGEVTDEQIRAALLTARWSEQDVEKAIHSLRNRDETVVAADDTHARLLFQSDSRLSPEAMSSLLGVHIAVHHKDVLMQLRPLQASRDGLLTVYTIVFGLLLAFVVAMGYLIAFDWLELSFPVSEPEHKVVTPEWTPERSRVSY